MGWPLLSFRISPPFGFAVSFVMFDSSRAFAFTNDAWPLACVRITGLFGETLSSDACVGKPSTFGSGVDDHFS